MFKADVTLESLESPYVPLRNFRTTFDIQYICHSTSVYDVTKFSVNAYTLENNNLYILSQRYRIYL